MHNKVILAIETSCDETAAAVIKNGRMILSNVIASQIAAHEKFGGVVPEIASRKHIEAVSWVIDAAMEQAGVRFCHIDAVAATYGPGLVGALLVGLSTAKALSFAIKKPFIGVNHIEGHICANYLENDFAPPFICLVVSGGHTHIVAVDDYGKYRVLGRTKDDACGEAYDKIARALGLSYPGGPKLDLLAKQGDCSAIQFPRALFTEDNFDFSFSGLKSAVLNYLNRAKMANEEVAKENVAASFQQAAVDVLVQKTAAACQKYKMNKVALAGGVSANSYLRERMKAICGELGFQLQLPAVSLCTDNAAMIGSAAYFALMANKKFDLSLNAYPNLKIEFI